MESSAQAYANRCVYEHSHGEYGENLYIRTGKPSKNPLTDAGIKWWSEAESIGIDDTISAKFDMLTINGAGHFTQVYIIVFFLKSYKILYNFVSRILIKNYNR